MAAGIKGKALNAVAELPEGAMVKDGAFKTMVSTEEAIQLNAKWKAVESYTPTAKLVFSTNTLPTITDRSKATFNRILLIQMNRDIVAEGIDVDPDEINARLQECMAGIVAWATEGARRLYRNKGKFTEPSSSREAIASYKLEQNPFEQFVAERCFVVPSHDGRRQRGTPIEHLVRAFNRWHEGGTNWTKKKVSSTLTGMALAGVEVKKVKWRGGASLSTAVGLEMREHEETPLTLEISTSDTGEVQGFRAADPRDDEEPAADVAAIGEGGQ
jgi:phage/plasmid-associated DNA primase